MPSLNEQVAVLTALQKMVKERLAEVRAAADEALINAYDEDGVVKKALRVNGVKVGDHIVVLTSGEWAITDTGAFNDFALAYGLARLKPVISSDCMARAISVLEEAEPDLVSYEVEVDPKWQNYITNSAGCATLMDSGEPVPGVAFVGQTVKGTQVRGCKPADVIPVIQRLGGVDQLLLGAAREATTSQEA